MMNEEDEFFAADLMRVQWRISSILASAMKDFLQVQK